MLLFLDDVREPSWIQHNFFRTNDWEVVRSYDEFVGVITLCGAPEVVSLDHDLADVHYDPETWHHEHQYKEKTGYDAAKFLLAYCLENKALPLTIYCHSANTVGRERIISLFKPYYKSIYPTVVYEPIKL